MLTVEIKRISFLAVALSLFFLAGGPLVVFQGFAWGYMMKKHLKTDSLITALDKTFSGKNPCSLCKKIQKERSKEATSLAILKIDKLLKNSMSFATGLNKTLFPRDFIYSLSVFSIYQSIIHDLPEPYP